MDPLSHAEAYLAGAGLLDEPGNLLYSADTTLCRGPVYLLGLNPGGSEGETLRASITRSRNGVNAYLDDQWAPAGKRKLAGEAVLQKRVTHLCEVMGLDTRLVPASNLAFTRSTRISTHNDFAGAVKVCLPVHGIFMDAIQPGFLMTYGSIANFRKVLKIISSESRSARHQAWQAHRGRAVFCGQEVRFGNIPHMSVWASNNRPDILQWTLEAGV